MAISLKEGENRLDIQLAPVVIPTATLMGIVTEIDTSYPIANVLVTVVGTSFSAVTGSNGAYRIENIPPDVYTIRFSHPDFQTMEV